MSIATLMYIFIYLRGPLSLPDLKLRSKSAMSAWVMIFQNTHFFLVGCISDFPNFSLKKCEFLSMEMGRGKPPVEFVTDPVDPFRCCLQANDTTWYGSHDLENQDLFQLQKSHVDDNWRLILHWLPWEPSDSSRSHRTFSRVSHNSKVSFLEDLRQISWDGSLTSCCPKAARFWVWPGYNI